MARLCAALGQIEDARDMCVSAMQTFVDPNEDESGADRIETVQAALMSVNGAGYSLQEAFDGLSHMTPSELSMPEPHFQDDSDGEEADEEEGDEAEGADDDE